MRRFAAGGRFLRRFAVCGGRPFFAAFCGLRWAAVFYGVLRLPAAGRYLRLPAGGRFLRRLAVCGGRPFLRRFAVRGVRPFFAAFRGWRRAMRAFFCGGGVCVFAVFVFCGGRAFFCGILCVFSAVFGGRAIVFLRSLRWRFRSAFCAFCGVCVWRRAGGFSQLKSQPSDPQCCSTSAARAYPKVGTFQLDNHYSLEL